MIYLRRLHLVTTAAALCLCLMTDVAFAQDLTAEEIEQFKELTAEGAQLYEEGEFAESIVRLRDAQEIYDHPDLTYNIGRALAKLKRCGESRATFEEYLGRDDLKPQDVTAAKDQVAELSECREEGTVVFACNVPAQLSVDGEEPRACDVEMDLQAGEHRAVAVADGYERAERRFDVTAGEEVDVRLDLAPLPEEPTEPKLDWQTYAGWGGVGVGGALLVTGVAIDASAIGRRKRLEEASANGDVERLQELRDGAQASRTAAIVSYSVGALLTGAGVVLLLVEFGEESAEQAGWQFGISATGVTAAVRW